jgi:hypothetical protein
VLSVILLNNANIGVKYGTLNADNATYGGEKEFLTARTDFFGSDRCER